MLEPYKWNPNMFFTQHLAESVSYNPIHSLSDSVLLLSCLNDQSFVAL